MYRSEGGNGGCLVAEEAGMSKTSTAIKCRNSSCHYLLGMSAATKHAHTDICCMCQLTRLYGTLFVIVGRVHQ